MQLPKQPAQPAVYHGLEASTAFARVHPPPEERKLYVSRPDLDMAASRVAHEHYMRSLEDERAALNLLMRGRNAQRELVARQGEEMRALEQSLKTPYQLALVRKARATAEREEALQQESPQFADMDMVAKIIAESLARGRGVCGGRSGVISTQVRERQLRGLLPGDSRLMHAPANGTPTANVLAVARVNARVAAMRTGGAVHPLTVGGLHSLIAHMLEEKIQADAVDDAQRHARQTLPAFVADELWRRYGLREMAEKHANNFRASAVERAEESERVRTFAGAMGWLEGGEWTEPKAAFYLAFVPMLFDVDSIRERLSDAGPVWLSLLQLRQAVRKMLYSKGLEEQLIEELEALGEKDPTGEHLSGRRISFDKALGCLLARFTPTWDTIVSHLHRPVYAEEQLFLSKEAGHYTQQVRESQGHRDVLPDDYARGFQASSTQQSLSLPVLEQY
ncbi:hypothetical protein T492DRAFT_978866 [Pavlovales sp. CCMP2436]|nr:hypothetical protein T492DRAFT_978866 [Pavlovales sp. CCMP2436]